MPIYPYAETQNAYSGGIKTYYHRKLGYKSKDVYPLKPTEYSKVVSQTARIDSMVDCLAADSSYAYSQSSSPRVTAMVEHAKRRAHSKLKDKIFTRAALGTTLGERREAIELMVLRLKSLKDAFQALRKGRFGDFLSALNTRPKKRHERTRWTRPKDAASLWLEYWFGWSPLIADIYAVIDVLQGEYPPVEAIATSGSGGKVSFSSIQNPTWLYNIYDLDVKARATYRAKAQITNPSLFLANQLGVINPVSVAWELVPFSFVVDWFLPVGDFINSYTDWVGVELKEKQLAVKLTVKGEERYRSWGDPYLTRSSVVRFERELDWAHPKFSWSPGYKHSMTRAATQVSLLLVLFTKG